MDGEFLDDDIEGGEGGGGGDKGGGDSTAANTSVARSVHDGGVVDMGRCAAPTTELSCPQSWRPVHETWCLGCNLIHEE